MIPRTLGDSEQARPTVRTVAEAAGVSPTLVSFVFNERPGVSDTTRAHILKVADQLGYQPDPRARELRTGKATTMGLIVRNVANPFFNEIFMGMQERAVEDGISILAMDSRYDLEREKTHVEALALRRPAGLALVPVGDASSVKRWQRLRPGTPLAVVNARSSSAPDVPHVTPDDAAAVRLAFDHLYTFGHRRIAMLSAPPEVMPDGDRMDEYHDLCRLHGLNVFPIYVSLRGDGLIDQLRTVFENPAARPTAVITNSDHTAAYVYHAAHQCGLTLGQDLSVVGHDDLPTSSLLSPGLTTVSVNIREMGRQAYQRLIDSDLGNHREPVRLIVRKSTGASV